MPAIDHVEPGQRLSRAIRSTSRFTLTVSGLAASTTYQVGINTRSGNKAWKGSFTSSSSPSTASETRTIDVTCVHTADNPNPKTEDADVTLASGSTIHDTEQTTVDPV